MFITPGRMKSVSCDELNDSVFGVDVSARKLLNRPFIGYTYILVLFLPNKLDHSVLLFFMTFNDHTHELKRFNF